MRTRKGGQGEALRGGRAGVAGAWRETGVGVTRAERVTESQPIVGNKSTPKNDDQKNAIESKLRWMVASSVSVSKVRRQTLGFNTVVHKCQKKVLETNSKDTAHSTLPSGMDFKKFQPAEQDEVEMPHPPGDCLPTRPLLKDPGGPLANRFARHWKIWTMGWN